MAYDAKTPTFQTRTSTGAGSTVNISEGKLDGTVVIIGGAFTATVEVEMDDGTATWADAKAVDGQTLVGLTAPGIFVLRGNAVMDRVRLNCSAYTSGTIFFCVLPPGSVEYINARASTNRG